MKPLKPRTIILVGCLGCFLATAVPVAFWPEMMGGLGGAALFGLSHLLREPKLAPFAIWAVWEGLLLGVIYVWSGSLLLVMIVHAIHDIAGFSLSLTSAVLAGCW